MWEINKKESYALRICGSDSRGDMEEERDGGGGGW